MKIFHLSSLISHFEKGQSLIEVVLVMALSAIMLPALLTGVVASRQGKVQIPQRASAVALMNETVDALRSVRERGWIGISVNGTFHPTVSGSAWSLSAGSDVIGDFTRQIAISDVYRNPASVGPIVTTGGTLDPSSKKVVVTVSWSKPYSSTITSTLYMTRYLDNDAYIETYGLNPTPTPPLDFDLGTNSNTVVTRSINGEVTLGAGGGGGDWCQPSKSIVQVDLPKNGVANAISAIEGIVFAGTGDNAAGVSFAKIPLSGDPPLSASVVATYDPGGNLKTNGVFGEANYAYLATDTNSKEIDIIDLNQFTDPPTNSKYLEAGWIDIAGNGNANSIFALNNKAYVLGGTSGGSKLYIYDITIRSGEHTAELNSGGYSLSGHGKKILVAPASDGKTYAYIATDATSNQFEIVNVSTASNPLHVGYKTLGTSQAGVDLFVSIQNPNLSRAYFVTAPSSGKPDFFVLNITSKSSPTVVGSGYDTAGMSPKGLTVVTGNKAIIVGSGGTNQYQVLDISNETTPVSCAALQYGTGVNGVASILQGNGFAYSYIITGDAGNELKIILGGAGGQYSSSGNFTSKTFDPGYQTAFNRFDTTVNRPANTDIQFQIAAKQAISGSCAGVTFVSSDFVGPSGTNSDKFLTSTTSGPQVFNYAIPSSINPARCFRYKAFLTSSDPTASPTLYDFTVNYSP